MKLRTLRISGFRAIPPERTIKIDFNGPNTVIHGENGTGKSSILSAIEFLIANRITHLRGEGTGELSTLDHAPHVAATPEECWVEGEFIANDGRRGTVRRTASSSSTLEQCDGTIDPAEIALKAANADHLILTRGELLEFIESSNTDRGKSLHKLLRLDRINNREGGLQTTADIVDDRIERLTIKIQESRKSIRKLFELDPTTDALDGNVLTGVNQRRRKLDGDPLSSVSKLETAAQNVKSPAALGEEVGFSQARLKNALREVQSFIDEEKGAVIDSFTKLRTATSTLADLDDSVDQVNHLELYESAQPIVDESTTICPLCTAEHPAGHIHRIIQQRRERLEKVSTLANKIDTQQKEVLGALNSFLPQLAGLMDSLEGNATEALPDAVEQLQKTHNELKTLQEDLQRDPRNPDLMFTLQEGGKDNRLRALLESEQFSHSISAVRSYLTDLQPADEYTEAYDQLRDIEDLYAKIQETKTARSQLFDLSDELHTVTDLFADAKRSQVEGLYDAIEADFETFYRKLHPDEHDLSFDLERHGAKEIGLRISFYDAVEEHPLAYHSEGHVDTMAIALFLALWKHRRGNGPSVLLLDDVVMSVDRQHRRRLSKLFRSDALAETQLVLTTHDEVWKEQLIADDVVHQEDVTTILDWDLKTGPALRGGRNGEIWDVVEEYLEQGDRLAAATHMRRGAEQITRRACIRLQGELTYGRNPTLSDFVAAVNRRINQVTDGVKKREDKTNGDKMFDRAVELSNRKNDVLGNGHSKALNKTIHFDSSEWGALSVEDLQAVVERWEQIEAFLSCSECGAYYRYSRDGDCRGITCRCDSTVLWYES